MGEGMSSAELEHVRRSLAMAPSIPKPIADQLLAEVHRLRAVVRSMTSDLTGVTSALRVLERQLEESLRS